MKNDLGVSFYLGLRSIQRGNIKTSLLIIFVLVLLVINFLLIPSLLDDMDSAITSQVVDKQMGNLFLEPFDEDDVFLDAELIAKKIMGIKEVIGVSPHYVVEIIGEFEETKSAIQVYFVDPVKEEFVTDKSLHAIEGDYLSTVSPNSLYVGVEKAGSHEAMFPRMSLGGVVTGDEVIMHFPNGRTYEARVDGVFQTKLIEADFYVYANEKLLKEIYGAGHEVYTNQILIRLMDGADEHAVLEKLDILGIKGEKYISRDNQGLVLTDTFKILKFVILTVSIFISLGALFIVIYINTINRKRLIGIMQAIGVNKRIIIGSFVFQSMFYSLISYVLAVLVMAFVVVPFFQKFPLDFPFALVSLSVRPSNLILAFVCMIIVSIFSGYLPVKQIADKKIVDSLRAV